MNKSIVFKIYNNARRAARQGKLDEKRVNRALGLVLSGKQRPYNTTIGECDCPDSRRGLICKHRIAAMMIYRINEMQADLAVAA